MNPEELKSEIEKLQNQITWFEPNEEDFIESYEELLDCDGPISIGTLKYYPSEILKKCDPIAYRCGLLDYIDSIDLEEISEYQELQTKLEELKTQLNELN